MSEFIPIPGYEGIYKINKQGEILGPYRKLLKQRCDPIYPKVYLYKDGKRRHCSTHVLMMLTFVGERPDGLQIRHKDGDPTNNKLDNLVYGTPSENIGDQSFHGTRPLGEDRHNSVMTERTVRIARGLYKLDYPVTKIACILGFKYHTVSKAIHQNWAYLV